MPRKTTDKPFFQALKTLFKKKNHFWLRYVLLLPGVLDSKFLCFSTRKQSEQMMWNGWYFCFCQWKPKFNADLTSFISMKVFKSTSLNPYIEIRSLLGRFGNLEKHWIASLQCDPSQELLNTSFLTRSPFTQTTRPRWETNSRRIYQESFIFFYTHSLRRPPNYITSQINNIPVICMSARRSVF